MFRLNSLVHAKCFLKKVDKKYDRCAEFYKIQFEEVRETCQNLTRFTILKCESTCQWFSGSKAFCCQDQCILKIKHFGCNDLFTAILLFHLGLIMLAIESQPKSSKWGMMDLWVWQARAFYRVITKFFFSLQPLLWLKVTVSW